MKRKSRPLQNPIRSKRVLVSVIIPTFNRKEILARSLRALSVQVDPPSFEVLVVDDGSRDGTEDAVNGMRSSLPFQVRYFPQENKGPATARNRGIQEARGDILLFLGDDMIAVPSLLREHYQWHSRRYRGVETVVLGPIEWDPSLKITPLMEFLEFGPQFRFREIHEKIDVDFNYFVSSNASGKRKFLGETWFNTTFPHAAWEDLEFAYRLHNNGMKLRFNEQALCHHDHAVTMKSFQRRGIVVGRTQRLLYAAQPDLKKSIPEPIPPGPISRVMLILLGFAYPFCMILSLKRTLFIFYSLLHKEFVWRGYREGRENANRREDLTT